jgi:hypothetical protein
MTVIGLLRPFALVLRGTRLTKSREPKFRFVPTYYGLYNVADKTTGRSLEVDATAILLERPEALQLISWLLKPVHSGGKEGRENFRWLAFGLTS